MNSKKLFTNLLQRTTKFNFLQNLKSTNNSNFLLSNSKINKNFQFNPKFNFTEKSDDDTHSDFKPKSKVQINDSNVMEVIDDWVQNNNVVLFMKGTKEMPKCGFSNYACQVMKFYNLTEVKCVNILEDNTVREAVKKYSNWPTYPQLYVKGSLVGGCDILKEMHENGSFKELVEREDIATKTHDI